MRILDQLALSDLYFGRAPRVTAAAARINDYYTVKNYGCYPHYCTYRLYNIIFV